MASALVVKPRRLPATSQLALSWLRNRLQPGTIHACSSDLLHTISYCGYDSTAEPEPPAGVNDMVGLLSCEDIIRSAPPDMKRLAFFKVINANPSRRVVIHPYHLGSRPPRVVAVCIMHFEQHTQEGSTVLRPEPKSYYLDLDEWSSWRFCDVVQGFYTFGSIQFGSRLCIERKCLQWLLDSPVGPAAVTAADSCAIAAYGDLPVAMRSQAYDLVSNLLRDQCCEATGNYTEVKSVRLIVYSNMHK